MSHSSSSSSLQDLSNINLGIDWSGSSIWLSDPPRRLATSEKVVKHWMTRQLYRHSVNLARVEYVAYL
ncbi:hypothetical protein PHLCEN_2v877 [Hermanssonia centrifuga]|uniref:Uncharacterized protein n=1 Tax=Hermanssonia centrifuga TaxID=98765 RepID=A0A2R6S4R4_9APHY|nr:hypothetical protein PHLCEN_2v877 [Hermanssonia centrifuga]